MSAQKRTTKAKSTTRKPAPAISEPPVEIEGEAIAGVPVLSLPEELVIDVRRFLERAGQQLSAGSALWSQARELRRRIETELEG